MKKLKILTVFGILLAMGITACNNQNSDEQPGDKSGEPAQSQQQGGQSQGGEEGHKTHTWDAGEVTTQPGCETEGVKTFKCTYEGCNETKTETIPALGHQWGQAIPVTGADGGVDYNKFECERNNKADKAVKYEVALNKAVDKNGKAVSEVSGAAGFVKLGSNGNSIYLKFNSDAYGKGKLYLRGSMDYWYDDNNHNENRTLFSGKDGNDANDNKENPNLEVKVNGVALTVTNKKPMSELLPQVDADHPAVKSGNSPAGEVLYGDDLVVGKGLNEIVYTRKDSYNLAVSHLLFVFVPEAHENHTMTEWADEKAATCTEDGVQSRHCSVCGIVETQVVKAGHKWGAAVSVAADAEKGYQAYTKYECSECHKVKYVFAAKEAKDAADNNKTSNPATPDPYIKLKSNGKSFTIKFNAEKLLDGELYQEGIFDGWPENGKKFGYFSYTSSADNAKDGNFEVKVNGTAIDLSQYKGGGNDSATFNFFGWSGDEESQTFTASGDTKWSKDMVCPVGHVSIEKGEAEIVYKRLESYNLAAKNIILIVNEYDHEHTKSTTLSSDDTGHWYTCSDANCPLKGIKLEYAKHTLEADESKTDEDSTCAKEGKHYVKCSVCEKEITQVIEKKAHTWVADESKTDVPATCAQEGKHYVKCSVCDATDVQPIKKAAHTWVDGTVTQNSDGKNVTSLTCSNECGKVGAKIAVADYSSASIDSGLKFKKNSDNVWKIIAPKAGKYEIRISAKIDAVNTGHYLNESPVTVKVGTTPVDVSTETFGELGVGTSDVAEFVLVPEAVFVEGENTITLSQGGGGFRLTYGGDLVICEL